MPDIFRDRHLSRLSFSTTVPALIAAVIVFAFLLFVRVAVVDIPMLDDLDALLRFGVEWRSSESWKDALHVLAKQQNDHRIVLPRIQMLAVLAAFARVRFDVLALAGNLQLIGAVFLLAAIPRSKSAPIRASLVLVCSALVLHPQGYDVLTWSVAALAFNGFLFFTALASLLLSRDRHGAAVLASIVGAGTLGAGIAAPVLGTVLAALNRSRSTIVWLAGAALVAIPILFTYAAPEGHPDVATALVRVDRILVCWFGFLGASAGFSDMVPSVISGIGVLAVLVVFTVRGGYRTDPGLVLFAGSIVVAALLCALSRSGFEGTYTIWQPRYKTMSSMALAVAVVTILEMTCSRPRVGATVSLCAVVFWAASMVAYCRPALAHSQDFAWATLRWDVGGSPLPYPYPSGDQMMRDAERLNLYRVSDTEPGRRLRVEPSLSLSALEGVEGAIDEVFETEHDVAVRGWIASRGIRPRSRFLVFGRDSEYFRVPLPAMIRLDVFESLLTPPSLFSGFMVRVKKDHLPVGHSDILIAVAFPDGLRYARTGRSVNRSIETNGDE